VIPSQTLALQRLSSKADFISPAMEYQHVGIAFSTRE